MSNKYNSLDLVREFHEKFGHPVNREMKVDPKILPLPKELGDLYDLRIELLEEELKELRTALLIYRDPIETLDALCDLQYVLNGAILSLGFTDIFEEAFKKVHESNMSKLCKTEDEAQATIDKYAADNIEASYEEKDGYFVVIRDSDGKILKSINYTPVDLKSLVSQHRDSGY